MRSELPPTFVFMLGTGRCGSSLLQEILAQHDDVGFLSNIEDLTSAPAIIGRWNGPIFRRMPPSFSRKGRARFAPSEGYRILDRRVSPAISTPFRDLTEEDATPWLAGRFRRFFEERAHEQERPVFIHKFTGWPRARFIDAVLPEVRFVHVIRDGRAVANSLLQMPWWQGYGGPSRWGWGPLSGADELAWEHSGRSFPVLAALEWKVLMDAFALAEASVNPERWLEIRYEDLVGDPVATTKQLLEFLGLDWSTAFEGRFQRYRFDTGRIVSYRSDLDPTEIATMTGLLEGHLGAHGYGGAREGSSRERGLH
jgi:hypothetical protein